MTALNVLLALSFCLPFGCSLKDPTTNVEVHSKSVNIEELADKSLLYRFPNGVSCNKRADYTSHTKTGGAAAIKQIFEFRGDFERKWEHAKQYSPRFEELEAVFFDICYDFGEGLLSREQYDEERKIYTKIRERILRGADEPSLGASLFSERLIEKSPNRTQPGDTLGMDARLKNEASRVGFRLREEIGYRLGVDITVRNPTSDVIQINTAHLTFQSPVPRPLDLKMHGSQITNRYTVTIQNDNVATVSDEAFPASWHRGEAQLEDCTHLGMKVPVSQTVKSNEVDRFTITLTLPDVGCFTRFSYQSLLVRMEFNEGQHMGPKELQLQPSFPDLAWK